MTDLVVSILKIGITCDCGNLVLILHTTILAAIETNQHIGGIETDHRYPPFVAGFLAACPSMGIG